MSVARLFDLAGRVAVITGSGTGLGLAMARGLGEAGAHVVLNGRNRDRLDAAVGALVGEGLVAEGVAFDIADAEAAANAIRAIEARKGKIDILINNAGVQHRKPLEEFEPDEWRRVLATNLDGVFNCTRVVLAGMKSRRRGKIINICSVMSEIGRPNIVPYTTSKGGVRQFTRGLAAEVGRFNVQVNGIAPGFFNTEMNSALVNDPEFNAWVCRRSPAGRWGDPAELAGTAIYLASGASDYVNGHIVYVDGGLTASV